MPQSYEANKRPPDPKTPNLQPLKLRHEAKTHSLTKRRTYSSSAESLRNEKKITPRGGNLAPQAHELRQQRTSTAPKPAA